MNEQLKQYFSGNCDLMALALNRITQYPLGIFSAKVPDDFEDDGFFFEDAHAVVIVDPSVPIWMDAGGLHEGIPDNLYFSNAHCGVVLRPATEMDVRSAFTSQDISEDSIQQAVIDALKFVVKQPTQEEKPRLKMR